MLCCAHTKIYLLYVWLYTSKLKNHTWVKYTFLNLWSVSIKYKKPTQKSKWVLHRYLTANNYISNQKDMFTFACSGREADTQWPLKLRHTVHTFGIVSGRGDISPWPERGGGQGVMNIRLRWIEGLVGWPAHLNRNAYLTQHSRQASHRELVWREMNSWHSSNADRVSRGGEQRGPVSGRRVYRIDIK